MNEENQGSAGAGFFLGFLFGLLGLIIALCINKDKTTHGASIGFVISLLITIPLLVIYFLG